MKFVTNKVEKEHILCMYVISPMSSWTYTARPGSYEFSDVKLITSIVLRDNKTCV